MERFTIVVCFEDARRERFLMVRNRRRGWELPGGRVEPGEDPLAGARREFVEETGHELLDAQALLQQPRTGATAFITVGRWGPPVPGHVAHPDEAVVEARFVRRLGDVAPLAFPDDPYAEIERALDRRLV